MIEFVTLGFILVLLLAGGYCVIRIRKRAADEANQSSPTLDEQATAEVNQKSHLNESESMVEQESTAGIFEPVEEVKAPVEEVKAPVEEVKAPVEEVKAPVEEVKDVKPAPKKPRPRRKPSVKTAEAVPEAVPVKKKSNRKKKTTE